MLPSSSEPASGRLAGAPCVLPACWGVAPSSAAASCGHGITSEFERLGEQAGTILIPSHRKLHPDAGPIRRSYDPTRKDSIDPR